MSIRALPVLAVGVLVMLTGCSGGGDAGSSSGTTSEAPSSSAAPQYTDFDAFPGEALLFTRMNDPVGVRMKPVDAEWKTELAGKSAEPGERYLAVYVAVTGEQPGRGMDDVTMWGPAVRFAASASDCRSGTSKEGYCFVETGPASSLKRVPDGEWREVGWGDRHNIGTDVEAGATLIGMLGFAVPDSATTGDFQLCAPSKGHALYPETFPCVPVPAPGPRP